MKRVLKYLFVFSGGIKGFSGVWDEIIRIFIYI